MEVFLTVVVWIACIYVAVCGRFARGGAEIGGILLGLLLGPLGALVAWAMPGTLCPQCCKSIPKAAKLCPYCRTALAQ